MKEVKKITRTDPAVCEQFICCCVVNIQFEPELFVKKPELFVKNVS